MGQDNVGLTTFLGAIEPNRTVMVSGICSSNQITENPRVPHPFAYIMFKWTGHDIIISSLI